MLQRIVLPLTHLRSSRKVVSPLNYCLLNIQALHIQHVKACNVSLKLSSGKSLDKAGAERAFGKILLPHEALLQTVHTLTWDGEYERLKRATNTSRSRKVLA